MTVINGMATHFHEKRMDILTTWSWKLFVSEWAILVDDMSKEREREEEREQEREAQKLKAELNDAHLRGMAG